MCACERENFIQTTLEAAQHEDYIGNGIQISTIEKLEFGCSVGRRNQGEAEENSAGCLIWQWVAELYSSS